jgi:alginate O-acetyltransferase complex protein AlgI
VNWALPLGISFYVFKHIGYLLDVRQNSYPASDDLLSFVTFAAFFPQITAGPLSGYQETATQFRTLPGTLSTDRFYSGVVYICVGLFKKLLIADPLAVVLKTALFSQPANGTGVLWAWFTILAYALQLYFDFTSYTDIALGIGIWFGVSLPPNFSDPYLATNPRQFWQRWHMSLSNWFRLYFFSPVSRWLLKRWGSGHSERAQYSANILTMTLIGL